MFRHPSRNSPPLKFFMKKLSMCLWVLLSIKYYELSLQGAQIKCFIARLETFSNLVSLLKTDTAI